MTLNLKAQKRDHKLSSKQLRKTGLVPCSMYGKQLESTPIQIQQQSLNKFLKSGNQKVYIEYDGQKYFASVEEAQKAPAQNDLLHVSFHAFKPDENISLDIPVQLVGEAKGVKEGGLVQQLNSTVNIYGQAQKLPEFIEINIGDLEVGSSLHVSDLGPSKNFEIREPEDKVLVSCNYPRVQSTEPEVESEPEKIVPVSDTAKDLESTQLDKEAA